MSERNMGDEVSAPRKRFSPAEMDSLLALENENQEKLRLDREAKIKADQDALELKSKAVLSYPQWHNFRNELKQIEKSIAEYHAGDLDEISANVNEITKNKEAQEAALFEIDKDYASLQVRLSDMAQFFENGDKDQPKEGTLSSTIELYNAALEDFKEITKDKGEIETTIKQINNTKELTENQIADYDQLVEDQRALSEKIKALEENPELINLTVEEAKNEQGRRNLVKNAIVRKIPYGIEPERAEFIGKIVDQFIAEEEEARGISKIDDRGNKIIRQQEFADGLINGFNITDLNVLVKAGDDTQAAKLLQGLIGGISKADYMPTSQLLVMTKMGGGAMATTPENYFKVMGERAQRYLETLNLLLASSQGCAEVGLADTITVGFNPEQVKQFRRDLKNANSLSVDINGGPIVSADASERQKAKINKDFQANMAEAQNLAQGLKEKMEQARKERIGVVEKEIERLMGVLKRFEEIDLKLKDLGDLPEKQAKVRDFTQRIKIKDGQLLNNKSDLEDVPNWKYWERNKFEKEQANLEADKKLYTVNLVTLEENIEEIQKLQEEHFALGEVEQINQALRGLQNELAGLKG